jgi:uncharacterized protein (DUF1697 family)
MAQDGWVALLRAFNLGARNKVPMTELRSVLEEAGCRDVRTYIQSGNVLFTKPAKDRAALARKLEREIEKAFGVAAPVVLRTFAEIRKVAAARPFGRDVSDTHVSFLVSPPKRAAVRELQALDIAPDCVKVVGENVFVRLPNGVQGAKLTGTLLERTIAVPGTMRTFRTVAKLAEMTEAAQ